MYTIYDKEGGSKVPVKIWSQPESVEQGAIEQSLNASRLPFVFKHIASMADLHQGYGINIGGVVATKDYIVPNAVGVDGGCGVSYIKTHFKEIEIESLKKIMGKIRETVPMGKNNHSAEADIDDMPYTMNVDDILIQDMPVVASAFNSASRGMGSLGSNNHFIEFQKSSDGHICVMVHSGSRNLGYQVGNHYDKKARELNAKYFSSIPANYDMAFLPVDSKEGQAYLRELQYCLEYAKMNRRKIISNIILATGIVLNKNIIILDIWDCHHNYVALENHYGENVYVHRKGAVRAREGDICIIPGSGGTSSYICEGLGNVESFTSASHGAGRLMSRTEARKTLNLQEEKEKLDKLGIVHNIRTEADLGEASSGYKDIDVVMENQKDLVRIIETLKPIATMKG